MLDLINYTFGLGVACWISNLCIEGAESGIFISMSRISRPLKTYILSHGSATSIIEKLIAGSVG